MASKTKYPTSIREEELKNKVAADWFASHFMSDFLAGKACGVDRRVEGNAPYQRELDLENVANVETSNPNAQCQLDIGNIGTGNTSTLATFPQLSLAARAVLDAGRELWRYYHAQPDDKEWRSRGLSPFALF